MIDVIQVADISGYLHHQFIIWSVFSLDLEFYHHTFTCNAFTDVPQNNPLWFFRSPSNIVKSKWRICNGFLLTYKLFIRIHWFILKYGRHIHDRRNEQNERAQNKLLPTHSSIPLYNFVNILLYYDVCLHLMMRRLHFNFYQINFINASMI